MSSFLNRNIVAFLTLIWLPIACMQSACHAHFPWLTIDDEGHALLYFSEDPTELDYKLPEAVTQAVVHATDGKSKPAPLELTTIDTEELKGRRSTDAIANSSVLTTTFTYGNYHGTLLKYYAQHLPPVGAEPVKLPEELTLQASVAPAKTGIEVSVLWHGEPIKGVGVTIIDAEGETFEDKTDDAGKVSFLTQAEGLTGFVIGHTIKSAQGEWQGQEYTSESHYCTVTTNYKRPTQDSASTKPARYAPLPTAVASFGAAVCDGSLYVYSGHTGKPHDHSRDNLSEGFHRLKLDGQSQWESLSMQTPLQGLPLVTHDGKLYRVGGLHATNAAEDEADMHSVDEFAAFDPQTGEWMALPNLPHGRSSHDAVVLDGKLYVFGGWTLSGDSDGEWIDQGCLFDLTTTDSSWEVIPDLPFRRRALAVGHWEGKIVVLGGMDEDHSISQSVDCYDPTTKAWSTLADFPGEGMSGFGVSAWNAGDKLFASGSDGVVYHLSDDGSEWLEVDELETPRFFHRLLAAGDRELLILGGAPLADAEHLNDIEVIELN
ncbi:MAG: hypothetical protein AAGD11_07285 [Planctomycetota bacterium]